MRTVLALALLSVVASPTAALAREKGGGDRGKARVEAKESESSRKEREKREEEREKREEKRESAGKEAEKKAREQAEKAREQAEKAREQAEKARREAERRGKEAARAGGEQKALDPSGRQPLPAPVSNPAPSSNTAPPPPPPAPAAVAAAPSGPADPRLFGYGAQVADLGRNGALVRSMGFNYVKGYLPWSGAEPSKGVYQWAVAPHANDADNIAADASRHGLKLLLRVDTAPDWAAQPGYGNRPPRDPQDFADFMGALASHLRGRVAAYELWNEPNLAYEWGGQAPSPEHFARMVQAAYPAIKAADPGALVITGGLATTGGDGGATALDDLEFLRRMYAAGAAGHYDALGSHPYGFASGPATRHPQGMDFQRAADHYALMAEHGDGDKAVWATELGWLLDPAAFGQPDLIGDPSWVGREWQRVDPQTQAQHLVAAFEQARAHWPWMGPMFLFNVDFSTVPYYTPGEQMRWYAVVNPDGSPRPAFDALRVMPKPVR